MKGSKILSIIIIIIGVAAIAVGVMLSLNSVKTEEDKDTEQIEVQSGADSGLTPEEFYNWETNLNIKATEIMDEIFKDNYTLDANGEFNITLAQLGSEYNADLSDFNNETIKCDLEKSTIQVIKYDGESFSKIVTLSCTNLAE